jgi:aspartyl/asparaginyl-tRNA synthetase
MLDDKTLMKISLVISIIGLVALFAVTQAIEPKAVEIRRIDDTMIGQTVEVAGKIDSFSAKDGNVFILLNGTGDTIKVVMFERDARSQGDVYDLKENYMVSVVGKVALYRTELEIVADSIKAI